MVKVVIVNGMPESGKTTFQNMCSKLLADNKCFTVIKSSVDWVKDIAKYCGWDGTKTEKNRKFLSDLKRVLTDWDDAILNELINTVDSYHYTGNDFVIFIDIREPKEIEKAKKVFNATTLVVRRPQVESNFHYNSSDMNVFNYSYDYTVWNDRGVDELNNEANKFIETILSSDKIYKSEESYL